MKELNLNFLSNTIYISKNDYIHFEVTEKNLRSLKKWEGVWWLEVLLVNF